MPMTPTTLEPYSDTDTEETIHYRAIHTGAIFALALGVFSAVMLLLAPISPSAWMPVTVIPVVGISVSLWSLGKIRRDRDQYTGLPLAIAGLVLSFVFLVTGVSYGSYVYFTEVPDGYQRISFETLRPTDQQERANVLDTAGSAGIGRQADFHQRLYPAWIGPRANWDRSFLASPR